MASTYLTKTYSTTATSKKILTVSAWVKRSKLGAVNEVFSASRASDGFQTDMIRFGASDQLEFFSFPSTGGTTSVKTNRVFRDTSAWYHIVVMVNTTDGTAADRVRMYVNGVREASFATASYPPQNSDLTPIGIASGTVHTIGAVATSAYFDGSISHIHYCDGQAYDATAFGEYDANGVWKIKTSPSVTYGTNGFFILKDGNSVTDQSGNSNNFTVGGGTLTNTEDNPSNVFATMNPLGNYVAPTTLSQGNNTVAMTNSKGGNLSTLACTGGKYYSEMKIATMPQDSRFHIGILPKPISVADDPINTGNNGIMLSGFNAVIYANSGSGSAVLNNFYGNATGRFSGTPILGCAVDLSSATKTMAISINGACVTGSNTTDASFSNALKVDISTPVALEDDWFFGCGSGNGSGTTGVYNWNFGNGYFGTQQYLVQELTQVV